jgi:hypothetical protein
MSNRRIFKVNKLLRNNLSLWQTETQFYLPWYIEREVKHGEKIVLSVKIGKKRKLVNGYIYVDYYNHGNEYATRTWFVPFDNGKAALLEVSA